MTISNQDDCILLIVDVQEKLLKAAFNQEQVKKNSEILANAAEILDIPVFITEQYPKGLGATIETIKNGKRFEKTSFNALLNDDLLSELKAIGRKQILLLGIETHICVYQTAEALIASGFEVTVAQDACGSRFEEHYNAGLACIKDNGAAIKPTEMILFELLKGAKHPNFKEIQALIK